MGGGARGSAAGPWTWRRQGDDQRRRSSRHRPTLLCLPCSALPAQRPLPLHPNHPQAAAEALLASYPEEGNNNLLHYLCAGERLTLFGGLLWSLSRAQPHGGQWPARHQRARAELLAQLLARQPRLALLAGRPNAAGSSPLHEAVLSCSSQCLAVLLAALRQLLVLGQAADEPEAAAAGAAALQLLLSAQNAELLTPFELAIRQRSWAAARLLAAAASGAPPMSRPQLEACSLVQGYLGLARWQTHPPYAAPAGPAAASSGGEGIHLSASGATVADAAGRLLSKLWDALGSSAADQQLEAAPSSSGSSRRQRPQREGDPADALPLRPRALQQADVLALAEAEERCVQAGAAAPDASSASGAAGTAAAEPQACNVCFEELPAGSLSVRLPCGHATCDDCWRGILRAACDEGAVAACLWCRHVEHWQPCKSMLIHHLMALPRIPHRRRSSARRVPSARLPLAAAAVGSCRPTAGCHAAAISPPGGAALHHHPPAVCAMLPPARVLRNAARGEPSVQC